MAEVDPERIIGCLSLVYPTFIQREIARLTAESIAVLESVVDPIGKLADQNIDALIADVTGLTEGDVFENLVQAGLGLLWQEKVRDDLRDSINGAFDDGSDNGTFLERAAAKGEKLLSNIHLFLALSAEAPYAIAQVVYSGVQPFIDQKRKNIECMQHHVIQLSNVLLALGLNPARVSEQLEALLEALRSELGLAQQDIRVVLNNMLKKRRKDAGNVVTDQLNFAVQGGFLQQRFNSARAHLINADAALSPTTTGTSILDLLTAVSRAGAGDEFTFDANRILGIYCAEALIGIIGSEFLAIQANTSAINAYLQSAKTITAQLSRVKESSKVNEFRIRALRRMDQTLSEILAELPAEQFPDVGNTNFLMLKWGSQVRSLIGQADKIVNADLTQQTKTSAFIESLKIQLGAAQAALDAIDVPPDIVDAIESLSTLGSQVKTLDLTAGRLLNRLKAAKDIDQRDGVTLELGAMLDNTVPLASAIVERLTVSLGTLDAIEGAIAAYLAVDIPATEDLRKVIDMLNLNGLDRMADHIRAGLVEDGFNLSLAGASYAGAVAACLVEAADSAPDQATKEQIERMLDDVLTANLNATIAASDILSGGRVQFISDITGKIEDLNRNTQFAKDIIARLVALGADTALALQQTQERLSGLDVALGRVTMSFGSEMEKGLRNLTTKGFGPPGCP
jgi:hypothetical protein